MENNTSTLRKRPESYLNINEEKKEELMKVENKDKNNNNKGIKKNENENEEEEDDIQMVINFNEKNAFNSEKVKEDEKKEISEENMCGGCSIY